MRGIWHGGDQSGARFLVALVPPESLSNQRMVVFQGVPGHLGPLKQPFGPFPKDPQVKIVGEGQNGGAGGIASEGGGSDR